MTDEPNKAETAQDIADLKAELADLKAQIAPTPYDPQAAAKWRDEMHAMAERRMSAASAFSRADLEAFEAAAPTNVVKGIALRDARAPTGPSSAGASGQVTKVSASPGIPGSGTGWAREVPLSPPPGVAAADRLMAAEDLQFRRQRIEEAARLQAFENIAAEKK